MFTTFLKVLKHVVLVVLGIVWAFASFYIGWGLVYEEVPELVQTILDFTFFIPLHFYSVLRWLPFGVIALPLSGIAAIYLLVFLGQFLSRKIKRT